MIHSATKFLCGHSDVTGGAIVVRDEFLAKEIAFLQNATGTALGPFDCFLLLRGLKTLKIRMDAQQSPAEKIASFLSGHAKVSGVHYPGLLTHAGYDRQLCQARGGESVLSFAVGAADAAKKIAEATRLFRIAVSFGSVNSTISVPVHMSHFSTPLALRPTRGIPSDLVRLSIGIEDAEELIEDLNQGLNAV